jgi:hypothetical protein
MSQLNIKSCAMAFAIMALAACVQMPTEKQSVADLRPQITFKLNAANPLAPTSRVILDGQDMGSVQEFTDGVSALKVLPGTHQLQIRNGSLILQEERFYVADGVNKPFVVK